MTDVPLPDIPDNISLSPEIRLLVACSWIAPPSLEGEQAEKIAVLCRNGVDWREFFTLVKLHGVQAIAYAVLCRFAGDSLPDEFREALRQSNSAVRHHALFQTAELIRLIKLFGSRGIDAMPLKGVFLSHQLYGDAGMRGCGDLDILVGEEHIESAAQILESEGYKCDYHWHELTPQQQRHFITNIHHFDFTHKNSGLHVELHWNLGAWLPRQMQALLRHSVRSEWHGVSVNCLDDAARLLSLCDHGSRHEWCKLKWLGDVAPLFSSEMATDWKRLLVLAAEVDLQRILAHSALLTYWVYGVTLPRELRDLIRQEGIAVSLSESVLTSLQMNSREFSMVSKAGQHLRAALYTKRLRPALPYSLFIKALLVTPDDFRMIRLPSALFWLYYPLRPVFWFWRKYISPGYTKLKRKQKTVV